MVLIPCGGYTRIAAFTPREVDVAGGGGAGLPSPALSPGRFSYCSFLASGCFRIGDCRGRFDDDGQGGVEVVGAFAAPLSGDVFEFGVRARFGQVCEGVRDPGKIVVMCSSHSGGVAHIDVLVLQLRVVIGDSLTQNFSDPPPPALRARRW